MTVVDRVGGFGSGVFGAPESLNMVLIAGRLAAAPEIVSMVNDDAYVRLLVTVRTASPRRRVDVIPITWFDYDADVVNELEIGARIWSVGRLQRRFWSAPDGRRSRVEVMVNELSVYPDVVGPLADDEPDDPGHVGIER